MKLVLLACLAAVAIAAPQYVSEDGDAEIVRDERVDTGDGNFNFLFETTNGIYKNVAGRPAANGGQAMEGSYRFPLDDGSIVEVTFTADENGFQAQSDAIPTAHPLPAFVVELLAGVEELKRQGATWDGQGRRITRRK